MRRWHEERGLMMTRWRMEIAKHEGIGPAPYQPPIPPESCDVDDCHCYRGMGFARKRKPYDCGNPRCDMCHSGKWDKSRQRERQRAIEADILAG